MASSFTAAETYGTSPGTRVDTSYINLLSASIASGSDTTTVPNANPIAIPPSSNSYSYERWIQGHWTSSFTSISSITFWKYSGTLGTGVTLNAGLVGSTTYSTPVNTASAIATTGIPTSQGAGLTPTYSANYCYYIVLQLVVASTASSGSIGTMDYRFGWNEV